MRILLYVDGSNCQRAAEHILASVPAWRTAQVDVVSTVTLPPLAIGDTFSPGVVGLETDETFTYLQKSAEELGAKTTATLKAAGIDATTVILQGEPQMALMEIVKENAYDLVAIGGREQSTAEQLLLGSTAQHLVNHAPCSVLVGRSLVPDSETIPEELSPSPVHMMVAYDDTNGAKAALEAVRSLGSNSANKITVLTAEPLHAIPKTEDPLNPNLKSRTEVEYAQDVANNAAGQLAGSAPNIATLIKHGRVGDAIHNLTHGKDVDLVVIGASQHGFMERLFLGSTANDVLKQSAASIWVVRPPKPTS